MRNVLLSALKETHHRLGGRGLGKIKILKDAYEFFFQLFRPRLVLVQGHRMWLDEKDTLELATREIYEPLETEIFKQEIKPGQTVLDIGANIGYYTLIAAKLVGPGGRVYAFEPDPANFQLLKKNVEQNGYENVTLVNRAVADRNGSAKLYLNETNKGDHRIYDSKDGRPSITIQMIRLDEFFKKIDKKVHFIKMDIQGAEAAALNGMKGLIRRNRPLKLVSEFSPGSLKLFKQDPWKYLQTLQKLGFKLSEISESEKSIKPFRLSALKRRLTDDSNDYTNLFCLKK